MEQNPGLWDFQMKGAIVAGEGGTRKHKESPGRWN
jgi:hypothetical protein